MDRLFMEALLAWKENYCIPKVWTGIALPHKGLWTVTRFKSWHPKAGGIKPVTKKSLCNLLHFTGNPAYQPDAGSLEHCVKPIADTAADDGIGVQFLNNIEPFGWGVDIQSNFTPVNFGLPLVIDDQQPGACIQHR